VKLAEKDIKVVNTSDADIVSAFATPAVTATVTWKPQLAEVTAIPKTTLVFDSSKIPGEILDLMVVNSATLKANPKLGKALVGAWYETLSVMAGKDAKATAALEAMAKASGTDLAGFKGQLATPISIRRRRPRSPPPRRLTWSRRMTWCASSPSITACWAKAPRPSTWWASSSRAA
jgi:ABC transporter binding protein (urea carboxylase system)